MLVVARPLPFRVSKFGSRISNRGSAESPPRACHECHSARAQPRMNGWLPANQFCCGDAGRRDALPGRGTLMIAPLPNQSTAESPLEHGSKGSSGAAELDLLESGGTAINPAPPRIPFLYSRLLSRSFPLSGRQRSALFAVSVCFLCGFAAAGMVQPDRRGYGTHQQFGLPPCTFQWLYGVPCPSCGATTCFSHFVRGQWPSAIRANPAAFALAILCAACIPWAWLSCWSRRLLGIERPAGALLAVVIAISVTALVQWTARLTGWI